MGLRATGPRPTPQDALPGTQPRSLEELDQAPAPERVEIPETADLLAAPGQRAPAQAPTPAPSPSPLPEEEVRAPAGAPSDEDILAALEGPDEDIPSDDDILAAVGFENMSEAGSAVKAKLDERGFFNKLSERFAASFGRNVNESASFLRNKFGAENVKVDGERIQFRPDKKSGFKDFDPDKFSFSELGLDVADFGGDIVEGVLSTAIELGIVGGATAATGGAGTVPALAAGAAVGGAVGTQARAEALEALGGERDINIDELDQSLGAAGLNVAALGLGGLLKKVGGRAVEAIRGLLEDRPIKKVEQVALINKGVDDFVREQAVPVDPKQAAADVFGALDMVEKDTSKKVGIFIEDAIDKTQGRRFPTEGYLRAIADVFEDARVQVDPQTFKATITDNTLSLGSSNGKRALQGIVNQYNEIADKSLAQGGLDLREIDDLKKQLFSLKQAWQEGTTDLPKDKRVAAIISKIHNGMASDRLGTIKQALSGSVDENIIDRAFQDFAENADSLKEFKRLFARSDSAELAGDALIKKGNSERVIKLKNIIGEESPEWKTFRSSWMNKKMEEATSLTTGIFDARKFVDDIGPNKLGKEVHEQLFTQGEFRRLQKAAVDFSRIGLTDINNSPKGQAAVEAIVFAFSPFLNARARSAWALAKGNASAGDYLLNRGFVEMAERAQSVAEKRSLLRDSEVFRVLLNNSRKATVKGKEVYITTPAVRNVLRAGLGDEAQELPQVLKGISGEDPVTGEQLEPFNPTGDPDIDALLQGEQ